MPEPLSPPDAPKILDFLLSTRVQQEALVHGFRPANTDVAVRFPESPFVKNARYGIRVDPTVQAEAPRAEVLNNLADAGRTHGRGHVTALRHSRSVKARTGEGRTGEHARGQGEQRHDDDV